MPPDFSKGTKDILAKRSASLCSNPDCRTITTGPTSDPQKALSIGEAAHIYGALLGTARYRDDMTDWSRAEITNGIWLCRNCHKLVDNDPIAFPADLLFMWRGEHERHVTERLGTRTDVIKWELAEKALGGLFDANLLAKQIARERLPYWEYRLTAELLRTRFKPSARAWGELKTNLRVRQLQPLDDTEVFTWFRVKLHEGISFIDPLSNLYTVELVKSWGPDGTPGDPDVIARVCSLLGDVADALVRWEEEVRFAWTSDAYQGLLKLLHGIMGMQLEKLLEVPAVLDSGIDRAEANPGELTVIEHDLVFELPEGWKTSVQRELKRIERETGAVY